MTQELPEPVRFIRRPWRRKHVWSGLSRAIASLTAFALLLSQLAAPAAAAEQNNLPHWLTEKEGGWVSPEQAGRMQRADQDLLAHLSALDQAQQRFTLSHPSGLQTQYVDGEMVVARDAEGNLLWAPTLDDYQKLKNGTLLLADGTLQVVRNGALTRQVDPFGNETVFGEDGQVEYEIAADGTRTTYERITGPMGVQVVRTTGGVTDRFSFDPQGRLYAAGSDRAASSTNPNPFSTTIQSFTPGSGIATGVLATDGTYLYVKPAGGTKTTFQRIGTGFNGTVAGRRYGAFTGAVKGSISAAVAGDGLLYQPDPTNLNRVEQINPANGQKTFVSLATPFLPSQSSPAGRQSVLITSDGRYVYNLSSHQNRSSATYNGWTVRVYDPQNNWAMVREFTAGTTSFAPAGVWSDGVFLYLLEKRTSGNAKTVTVRIADAAVVRSSITPAGSKLLAGQYDGRNQRLWVGTSTGGRIYAYDDPNDLLPAGWSEPADPLSPGVWAQSWPIPPNPPQTSPARTAPARGANQLPIGYLDSADPHSLSGWTVDPNDPAGPQKVRVLIDGQIRGEPILASVARHDLVAAGVAPNPEHGYHIATAALNLAPGTYAVTIEAQDSQTQEWTPLTYVKTLVVAAANPPAGYLDSADENLISGWAVDPDNRSAALRVQVIVDGNVWGEPVAANRSRPDLIAAGITPNAGHGYSIDTGPLGLPPGTHTLSVQTQDPQTGRWFLLTNSRTVVISGNRMPIGYLDFADLDKISGWSVDPDDRSAAQQVEILVDGVVKTTLTANLARHDLVAVGIAPNPEHGYSVATSQMGLAGGTYTFTARSIDTQTGQRKDLAGSHTVVIPANQLPIGYLDFADLDKISGWSVDPDDRSASQQVEILVDGVVETTLTADQLRSDLVAAGIAPNPEHGYFLPTADLGLAPGTYTITVQSIDTQTGAQAVLVNSKTLTIHDRTAPTVEWLSPSLVNTPTLTLSYRITDNVDSPREVHEPVTLQEGENRLTRTAVDVAGNQTVSNWTITLDTIPPVVVLTSPTLTKQPAYMLTYTVDGAVRSESVTLHEGANSIDRTTTDVAGNQTVSNWTITLDTIPPVVVLTSPTLTKQPAYMLTYTVDGAARNEQITLQEGPTSISRTNIDNAGNSTITTWTILLDTVPPVVVLTSATLTNKPSYILTYTAEGIVRSESVTLHEGANPISRTATDAAGNQTVSNWTVTLDTLPPAVVLTSATLTQQPAYSLTYIVDGISQNETVILSEGENVLTRTFTDPAGNATEVIWTITLDLPPPHHLPWPQTMPVGDRPEPQDPPSLTDGARLTQTLADGSIATFMDGALREVTTPAGERLAAPVLDEAGRITGGWLTDAQNTTTFLRDGIAVWSRDAAGTVTWYSSDGRIEAVRAADGTLANHTYPTDETGAAFTLVNSGEITTLFDAGGKPVEQLRPDGRWIGYLDGKIDRVEIPRADGTRRTVLYTRANGEDGVLRLSRPEDPELNDLPLRLGYRAEELIEAVQPDGQTLTFEDGLPADFINLSSVQRNGITRAYDAQGRLSSLTLPDQTILRLNDEAAEAIRLPDGSEVTGGTFDADSRLVSGTVTLPGGRQITYAGGSPTQARLPDGSKVSYTTGAPSGLTMPDGSEYSLIFRQAQDERAASWEAMLVNPDGTPLVLSPSKDEQLTRLTYSADWVLQEATRSDGALLTYQSGKLSTLTQTNSAVISYAYDDAGRLTSTVAVSPDPAEPALRTEYAYDKIRRVLKGTVPAGGLSPDWELVYDYSYEFEPDGTEITVIREPAAGLTKRYRAGLLVSQTDPDGAVTAYEYASDPAGYADPMETVVGLVQTLSDGTIAHYSRSPAGAWTLSKLTLTDGTELLPEELNPPNLLAGYASLEGWPNGPASPPDGWDPSVDTGSTIAQETSSTYVHSGTSSVRLSTGPGGGDSAIFRNIVPFGNKEALAKYEGKTVTLGAWVKTSDPEAALAVVLDDVAGPTFSNTHPGDGQWHFLTATQAVGRDIMKLQAFLITHGVNKTAYFDDAVFVVGPAILTQDFSLLLQEAALPTDPMDLRRMVENGTLTLIQSETPVIANGEAAKQSPVLTRATVTYQGKTRDSFTYTYSDVIASGGAAKQSLTKVTDSAGITRTYDATQRLVFIEQPDGTRYDVTHTHDLSAQQAEQLQTGRRRTLVYTDLNGQQQTLDLPDPDLAPFEERTGEEVILQHLSRRLLKDGTELLYQFGRLHKILLPNQRILTDFTVDRNGIPLRAMLTLPDGTTRAVQNGALLEVTRPEDGVKLRYRDGTIAEIHVPVNILNDVTLSSVGLDAEGRVQSGEVLLPSGDRLTLSGGRFSGARLADGTVVQSVVVSQDTVTGATLSVSGSNAMLNNSRDVGVTLSSGQEYRYRYRLDAQGNPTSELETMTFRDDFEDGNSLGWTVQAGSDWQVTGGDLRANDSRGGGDGFVLATTGMNWADYTVTTRFDYESFTGPAKEVALLYRWQGPSSYHMVRILDRSFQPDRHAGWIMELAGPLWGERIIARLDGFDPSGTHTLSVRCSGSNFEFTLDGQLKATISDGRISRGTVGVGANHSIIRFHDLEVTFPGEDLRDPATRDVDAKLRSLREAVSQAAGPVGQIGVLPAVFDPAAVDPVHVRVLEQSSDPDVQAAVSAVIQAASDPNLAVITEMDSRERPLAITKIDGSTTTFNESGNPMVQYTQDGRRQVTYAYDGQGRLIKTTLEAARADLPERLNVLRQEVTRRQAQASRALAEQAGVVNQELEIQALVAREQLANQKTLLENQLHTMESSDVSGKAAKAQKGEALKQIRGGIMQIQDAQDLVERQYLEGLARFSSEVASANQQIEEQTGSAFSEIQAQEDDFLKGIIRQEILPIIGQVYRLTIGRDPNSGSEVNTLVDELYARFGNDPNAAVNRDELEDRIRNLPDYQDRVAQVVEIKRQVTDWLTSYVQATTNPDSVIASEAKQSRLSALGLSPTEVVPLTSADADRILDWLNSGNLHFGHSAFLALQEFLAAQGIQADAVRLAVQAIQIDILVGVLHPKTTGDLQLSLFALQRVARLHGGSATPVKVSFEDLRSLLNNPVVESFTGLNPRNVAFSPTGQKIYVTQSADPDNANMKALTELDAATHATLRTLTFPGERWTYTNSLAVSANGRWLAVGTGSAAGNAEPDQRLFLVDAATFTIAATFDGFRSVTSVAFSQDGLRLYATDNRGMSGSGVAVIDLTRNELFTRWNLPDGVAATSLALAPTGDRLYVTTESSGLLAIVDTSTGAARLLDNIPPARYAAFHPNGRDLYLVHHGSNSVSIFNISTETIIGSFQTGSGPTAIAFSPDGAKAFVTHYYSGELTVIDTASRTITAVMKIGQGLSHLAVDPSSQRILVADNGGSKVSIIQLPGPVIAHVNGNHYFLITGIAADGTVTYREPNQGPTGETLTMSRAEFEQVWQGALLSSRAPPHAYQVLTDSEAQKITGALWPLIALILFVISTGLQFVQNETVQLIGRIIGYIALAISVFNLAFQLASTGIMEGIKTAFSGFGNGLISGIQTLGQSIWQGVTEVAKTLFNPAKLITAFKAAAPAAGEAAKTTLSQVIATTVFTTGVNVGVSKGLDALGVDPMISSLAGSLASGGITGGLSHGSTQTFWGGALSGAITSTAIAGTQIGLAKAGVDSSLAGIAGIGVGSITNTLLTSGVSGLGTMLETQLAPTLAGELAFYNIQQLATSVGLDPRISQLAGMPIKAGIGNIANPGNSAKSTLNAMWEGLKSGATSVGLQMATQALDMDPFSGALVTRALGGAISGALSSSHNIFAGVAEAFRHSAGNFSTIPPPPDPEDPRFIATLQNGTKVWDQAAYNQAIGQYEASRPVWTAQAMAKTNNFSDEIREFGLGQAVENYATSIFHRDSVESLVQSFGTIKNAIAERMRQNKIQNVTLDDGTQAKKLSLFDDKELALLYKEDPFGDVSLLSITEDEVERLYQEFRANRQTHEAGMRNGTVTTKRSDGSTVTQHIQDSAVTQIDVKGTEGKVTRITPSTGEKGILYTERGLPSTGTVTDLNTGTQLSFDPTGLTNFLIRGDSSLPVDPIPSLDDLDALGRYLEGPLGYNRVSLVAETDSVKTAHRAYIDEFIAGVGDELKLVGQEYVGRFIALKDTVYRIYQGDPAVVLMDLLSGKTDAKTAFGRYLDGRRAIGEAIGSIIISPAVTGYNFGRDLDEFISGPTDQTGSKLIVSSVDLLLLGLGLKGLQGATKGATISRTGTSKILGTELPETGISVFDRSTVNSVLESGNQFGTFRSDGGFVSFLDAKKVAGLSDNALVRVTGNAPKATNALLRGEQLYGIEFSTRGQPITQPLFNSNPNFFGRGITAVKTTGDNPGFLLNEGYSESTLFGGSKFQQGDKLGPIRNGVVRAEFEFRNGKWESIRK